MTPELSNNMYCIANNCDFEKWNVLAIMWLWTREKQQYVRKVVDERDMRIIEYAHYMVRDPARRINL